MIVSAAPIAPPRGRGEERVKSLRTSAWEATAPEAWSVTRAVVIRLETKLSATVAYFRLSGSWGRAKTSEEKTREDLVLPHFFSRSPFFSFVPNYPRAWNRLEQHRQPRR